MLVMQRPSIEALGEESNNRQQFAVGPLEPGFGHTLGNSLRRTLLSSIPAQQSRRFVSTRRSTSSARSAALPKT